VTASREHGKAIKHTVQGAWNLYWWFLSAVKWIAVLASGLCLAGAITLAALQVLAPRLWLGTAVCFVIFVIAANLERANPRARYDD
jgi:hypothetical protein